MSNRIVDIQAEGISEEIGLFSANKVLSITSGKGENNEVVERLLKICIQPGKPFKDLQTFRTLVPKLINLYLVDQKALAAAMREVDRYRNEFGTRSRKRWTEQEDEALIELITDDKNTIESLAATFGRSAGAISTRISYLVGIERLSQEVAGRFVGTLGGVQVDETIKGTIYK